MIKSVLLRRIFAVAIDSLYFFPGGIFFALFSNSGIIALIIMFTMFVCRDVIPERSIVSAQWNYISLTKIQANLLLQSKK